VAVIEDAAQCVGGVYRGQKLGALGTVGIYSFQINKMMTSGEGGALVTSDPVVYERAARFHDMGTIRQVFLDRSGPSQVATFAGENFRMNEFTGAVLGAQLPLALGLLLIGRADEFRAGTARVDITPELPFWLTGYASRNAPATNITHRLSARALALTDSAQGRVVIVTADLIGIPAAICEAAAARIAATTGWSRDEVMFNASHTHGGPVVGANLEVMFDLGPEERARVQAYAEKLVVQLSQVACRAIAEFEPARISYGQGQAGFAANRREPAEGGIRLGVNPAGPVDHAVPVLRVDRLDGRLQSVLFGYACHNTTLGGDCYTVHGDYTGEALRVLDESLPDATSLFLTLCGGDQNPYPRGTFDLAVQHGQTLAREVERVLRTDLVKLAPPIRTGFDILQLDFAPHTRETFVAEAASDHVFRQRRARLMLEAYDRGRPVRQLEYRIQAVQFGTQLTLLGLAGEVVVDYAHRARREFAVPNLVVAAYCNDVPCYIPTRRMLGEGGYEPEASMIYYGQPGPMEENVEDAIFEGLHRLLNRLAPTTLRGG
jgi:neutral ceramidase